jgi:hypothetical protein
MSVSSFLFAVRKSLTWSKIGGAIFGGWELREKILRPVIVNLLTALLLFLIAVLFKDPIYNYFAPRPESKDWPVYCVMEPEVSNGGPVIADLFVLNMTAKRFSGSDLDKLAADQSKEGPPLSALINIEMKDSVKDKVISEIKGDDEFNREKGGATAKQVDPRHWQIQINDIREDKILKFVIHTTEERPISSRASFETLPIKITYARSR